MSAERPSSGGGGGGLSDNKRKLLEQRLRGKGALAGPKKEGIPRQEGGGKRLASPGQRWIFIGQSSVPLSAGFNISSSFEIVGSLEVDLLERCVNQVVARHEVLRSNYRFEGDDLVQVIRNSLAVPVERVSCPDRAALSDAADARVARPFDLGSEPLVRVHHFQTPDGFGLLVLVVHDIIFDKWSLGIFWKEIAAAYEGELTGTSPVLPSLSIQFSDFSVWQEKRLAGGLLERQLAYWKSCLSELPPPLPLPGDRAYPMRLTDAGALERCRLSDATTSKLKAFAGGQNSSLFMLLLLGFQVLLKRYTQTDDIVVGSPVANRSQKELADLIGFFLSTVAIRSRFEHDPTVEEALASVREATLGALENQDVPYDRVVEAVNPPRVPGRHPLCQVMFVYQREHEATPAFELEGVDLKHVFVETKTAKFDLTLFTAERGSGMEFVVEYRTDLFDQATIARMLSHYEQLLESMVGHPAKKISELEMLTKAERQALLFDWQGPRLPLGDLPDLLSVIERHAESQGAAPAVISSAGSLSWAELDGQAEDCARQLRALGVGVGHRVVHFMERAPEALAGILGIMRAGAAYVPLDPSYPAERCGFIVSDSGVEVAVTSASTKDHACLPEGTVVVGGASGPQAHQSPRSSVQAEREQSAYMIYTSGSTGRPKGVEVSHQNLLHSTRARIEYYGNGPRRFLLLSSFSFDSSVAGIFWTLSTGGTIVLPSAEEQRDPALLCALIQTHEVTDLLCVPTLYRELLAHEGGDLACLERVILAGEECPPELVKVHRARLPNVAIFNEYGPTEATVWSVAHACGADEEVGVVPIGRPIANTSAHVLDRNRQLLPVGMVGELYLGGEGLAKGYYGRAELTKECFVDCILPGAGQCELYRTGDLARWRADGVLEFAGRVDGQVKINGYRIEPGEIEAVLRKHPSILEVVVAPEEVGRVDPTPEELDAMLADLSTQDLQQLCVGLEETESRSIRRMIRERFRLELHPQSGDFINPPREAQRNWILGQAMAEFADDLEHLDKVAATFVPGYDHRLGHDLEDITQAQLGKDAIMEDWQTPLMRAMARYATESGGDVLEIGFGRGVSAEFIQEFGVKSHTVVEMNDHSVDHYFHPWRDRHAEKDIRLHHARWQDVDAELGQFDGIFFHAFPMNEEEFAEYVLNSVTFAEHAFAPLAAHLRPGGVFTYLTTEIDSLSRRHQRLLLEHFSSLTFHVEKLEIPENTRDTWWAESMVVVKAVK